MKLKMTVDEALEFNFEWLAGVPIQKDSKGIHATCLVLAEEVVRMREAGNEAADILRREAESMREVNTLNGVWDGEDPKVEAEYDNLLSLADRLTRVQK